MAGLVAAPGGVATMGSKAMGLLLGVPLLVISLEEGVGDLITIFVEEDIADTVQIEDQIILEMMIFRVLGDLQDHFHTERHPLPMQAVSILLDFQDLGNFLVALLPLLLPTDILLHMPILQDLAMGTVGMETGMVSTSLSIQIKTKDQENQKTEILRIGTETAETQKIQETAGIKETRKT